MLGANKHLTILSKTSRGKRHLRMGRTVSILLDDSSVQLAAVKHGLTSSKIIACDKIYFPAMNDGESRKNFIISEIQNFIKENRGTHSRYLLGVAGSETTFRKITLPSLPKGELKKAVFWEASKRIPFGLDNSCYGYYLDPSYTQKEDKSLSVSLIAVPRSNIEQKLELLRPLGFKIEQAWHEQEAIGLMLNNIEGFDPDKTHALINIRKTGSLISYYRGTHLEFMHSSTIGTESLTENSQAPMSHEEFTERLAAEIQNSLDFYAGQFSSSYTNDLYVYGDLSYSEELIDKLAGSIGLKFKKFPTHNWENKGNPALSQQISISLGAVALGLADYDLIDFLPKEIREKRTASRFYRKAIPAMILFLMVLTAFWSSLKMQNDSKSDRLHSSLEQIERFKNSESYLAYNRIKRQLAADRAFLEKLQKDPTHLYLNLQELSRIVPSKIRLEQYDLLPGGNGTSLLIGGKATSFDPPPEIILAEFVAELETSPFYTNVHLSRHSKRNNRGEFEIDFQIEMDAVI